MLQAMVDWFFMGQHRLTIDHHQEYLNQRLVKTTYDIATCCDLYGELFRDLFQCVQCCILSL